MRKGKTARFKRQRRLQVELPGMGKAGALERRPYPPGQHGNKRRKFSDYALQLEEKQKILFHYGLRERQLQRFVKNAKRGTNQNWISKLVSTLELRLDNTVFRLGFAPSIPAAKQLICHGKVRVNGQKVNIRSAILKSGDRIELVPEAYQNQVYLQAKQAPRLPLPHFLSKEDIDGKEVGRITDTPSVEHIPFPLDVGLVTSYYSLKG